MDSFEFLSDACLAVQKGADVDPIWLQLRQHVTKLLEHASSAGVRIALNKLIRALGQRTPQVAHQNELSAVFIQYLSLHKKAWPHRVVAINGLRALCEIDNENVRSLRLNAFAVLCDCSKASTSHLTYRLAILQALKSAYSTQISAVQAKQAWKYARSLVLDPSLAISRAAIDLMVTIVRPEFVRTPAKFDKISQLCFKAWNMDRKAHTLLTAATFAAQVAGSTTVLEQLTVKCAEYPMVSPSIAAGIVDFVAACIQHQSREGTQLEYPILISTVALIFQNPKMRDHYRLDLAFQHVSYIIVEVIGKSIVEEKQRFALVQSVVTKLATSDKHHQLSSACFIMCLGKLLDVVVVSRQFADIVYQMLVALFELSSSMDLSLRVVDFAVKFLHKSPSYYSVIGTYCLEKIESSQRPEYAYLLGAVLVAANETNCMVELKPKIIELAMSLVKQRGQVFQLDAYSQGWILLQAFCSTPPRALRLFIPHYLTLFSHMLATPKSILSGNELRYQIEIWKPALDCVIAFARTSLITPDISRKLGEIIQNVWEFIERCRAQVFDEDPLIGQDIEIKRRLLGCFYHINFHGDTNFFPATLLTESVSFISESQEQSKFVMGMLPSANYCLSYVHDPISVLYGTPAVPPQVDMLDMSLQVVLKILPQQLDRVKESLMDSIRTNIEQGLRRDNTSASANSAYLFSELCKTNISEVRTLRIVDSILKILIKHNIVFAHIAVGNFIDHHKTKGGDFTKYLIDQIVATSNKPFERASYCYAIESVVSNGGLNNHNLREVVDILTTLAKDPHPAVHMAAIDAINASYCHSGLIGEKEALSVLEFMTQLYLNDTHCFECPTLEYSNLEMDPFNTWVRLSSGLAHMISLFGPNLQDAEILFKRLYRLIDQVEDFSNKTLKYTWECFQELFYYAKDRINWLEIISKWRQCINEARNPPPEQFEAATQGILLFANRAAGKLFELTGKTFQTELWLAYDIHPCSSLEQIFSVWAEQTLLVEPQVWIFRLQHVISKPRKFIRGEAAEEVQIKEADEEDESLGPQVDNASNDLFNPWTRELALEILISFTINQLHDKPRHERQDSLVAKNIGEIIKISFNAATCTVLRLQICGLRLLDLLIQYLYDLHDPDYPEVSLLEQYQAQISSALTPAFNSDSSYELANAVINVCGNFVGSRIIKNTDKFNKILKILTDPLKSANEFMVGQLKVEPLQASALRISILRFWAVLETDKSDVVESQEALLANLWVQALTDYTKLEFKPEDQSVSTFLADSIDKFTHYNEKQALLPVYRTSWVDMVSALAVLVENRGVKALSGNGEALLFGLVGLCFAELMRKGTQNSLEVLTALKQILQPGVCASVVYHEEIFHEVVEVLDRTVLTGSAAEKSCVVEIAHNLANSQRDNDQSVDYLFEIFRTCIFPLKELFPFLIEPSAPQQVSPAAESQLPLIKLALESMIDMAQVFRMVIQNDQFLCLLVIFEQILANPECQLTIVPHIFSTFKRLIEVMNRNSEEPVIGDAICNAFVCSLEQLKNAEANSPMQKNSLLICMVLVCTSGATLDPAAGNIREYAALLVELLDENLAVQSLRAILRTTSDNATVTSAFQSGCIANLVNKLMEPQTSLPKDVCNILVDYAKYSKDPQIAFAIVVPSLLRVLNSDWDTSERRSMYVRALLLMLVDTHPQTFRTHMNSLAESDKQQIQDLLLEPVEPEVVPEPTDVIALTSFN